MLESSLGTPKYDPKVLNTVRYLKHTSLQNENEIPSHQKEVSKGNILETNSFEKSTADSNNRRTEMTTYSVMPEAPRKYSLKDSTAINPNRITIDAKQNELKKSLTKYHTIKDIPKLTNFEKQHSLIKTKSKFHKKLMSDTNIEKHKLLCTQILKDDQELKQLMDETLGQLSPSSFIDCNLFSDSIFMYKLEILLKTETNKTKREQFFKREIKKILTLNKIDKDYTNKFQNMNRLIDKHINFIKEYNFV